MSMLQLRKTSMMSQFSRTSSLFAFDTDTLTDAELVKFVNELKDEIRILKLENEILENTIKRLEPALMHGVYQALEYATKPDLTSASYAGSFVKSQASNRFWVGDTLSSPSKHLSSASRMFGQKSSSRIGGAVLYGSGPKVNVLELTELISMEIGIKATNLTKARKKASKRKILLKAQLEEIDIRVSEIDKASRMFKQEVLIKGVDKIAQRIPAETWIRFMTEWVKATDYQISKLRLRTSTLNSHFRKYKSQIKIKADLSENLTPVDFEKISIENSECQKLIDRKILQINDLKRMAGEANLTLTVHKRAMLQQNNYLNKVNHTRMDKERQIHETNKECEKIKMEAEDLAQQLDEIRNIRNNFEAPDVMDYVTMKWNITELKRTINTLKNRAHVCEITLASINKQCQMLQNETEQSSLRPNKRILNASNI